MRNFNYVLNTPLSHGWGQHARQELSRLKVSLGWLVGCAPQQQSCAPVHCQLLPGSPLLQHPDLPISWTFYRLYIETKVRIWLYSQELNVWHSFILLCFRFYQKGLITYHCWCHVNYIKKKNLHENKSSALCAEFHMTSQKIITFLYNLKFCI